MKLENKVVVVTGGGNGVGREIVFNLLHKGARVAAVDINERGLEETYKLSEKSDKLTIHVVDITDIESVNNLVKTIKTQHGQVDVIINNAGIIQPFISVNEIEMDKINRVINVNFMGTLYMCKAFLPELEKRPEAHIVNVSSMGGFLPVPGQSIYGASKAAVKLLSEGMYAELKDTNVGISVIIPGGIATNIINNSNNDIKVSNNDSKGQEFLLTPKQAAALIVSSIEKNKFRMIIGKDAKIFNFLYKINSKFAINLISKFLNVN